MPGSYYEIDQAVGANTRITLAKEQDWGVLNPALSPNWKLLNVLAGEGLDQNLTIYRSAVIRSDGGRNRPVRGSQKPGGPLPFELSPKGPNQLFYGALGNIVSSTSVGGGRTAHILKRRTTSTTLPSFCIEKGFLDMGPDYAGILGCRVGGFSLNFNGDAIPTGTFDIMGREFYHSTSTKVTGTPADLTTDPFTSVQITVYEGSSLVPLGTARTLSLSLSNNMFGDNIRLGSNFRANLKRGTVSIGISGTFIFNNWDLFDKAVNGTDSVVDIVATNGSDIWECLLPAVELIPNSSVPKIAGDGPLETSINGEATIDNTEGTDMKLTITTGESSIST